MAITKIVVLMLENRSFDNVFGGQFLNSTAVHGLTGKETNPNPYDPDQPIPVHSTQEPVQIGGAGPAFPPTCLPLIDTGEVFGCMAQQFLSLPHIPTTPPYDGYDPSSDKLMQGFTTNYADLDKAVGQQPPPRQNLPDVMNYFTPEQLPVTAFLAANYGVCDEWFASAPTQTFTNRAFAVLAAPAVEHRDFRGDYSYIDDKQYSLHLLQHRVKLTSIFAQLDAVLGAPAPPNWKVYFHDYPISLFVDPYVIDAARVATNVNLAPFDDSDWSGEKPLWWDLAIRPDTRPASSFYDDVTAQPCALPAFSFIEPRYSNLTGLPPNSAHPGGGNVLPDVASPSDVPIDAASSELLLMQVYNLLQASTTWNETLLIVTFDEPGGTYDHVPPQYAIPPGVSYPTATAIPPVDDSDDPAANGFTFNILGGRVPAIVVSPQIAPGKVVRAGTAFDHTSIIRTVWDAFLPTQSGSLTNRDANAPSLLQFLDSSNPTGPFSGTIVCAPSSVLFTRSDTHTLFAGAGGATLSAALSGNGDWLLIDTTFANAILTVTLSADASRVPGPGMYEQQITIGGEGLTSVTVAVTLYLT
jgi:phospholipase C